MPTAPPPTAPRARLSWRLVVWGGAALLLAAPLAAMQVTREVAWTPFDFAVFAALLLCACAAAELAARLAHRPATRLATALAILAATALTWLQLAVGVIPGLPGGH